MPIKQTAQNGNIKPFFIVCEDRVSKFLLEMGVIRRHC